ncbi:U7 snRNA-associated Sm-like protein LSm11 [Petromyzon marinus]|uniref:U7 snRNA-associated Sm-like protein LSm11 n=1 Tax=Petromyzon marinus TaxID=7757 RepID=UPI003F6EDF77
MAERGGGDGGGVGGDDDSDSGGGGVGGDGVKVIDVDLSSPNFDPHAALYSCDVTLPYPNVRCFHNIAEFASFTMRRGRGRGRGDTPGQSGVQAAVATGKGRAGRRSRPAPDPERVERLKKLMVNDRRKKKKTDEDDDDDDESAAAEKGPGRGKKPRNVLTWMSKLEHGPLGGLYRCVKNRLPISVHVRTFRGLRGVCKGYLLAFDKFWNMALADVDEVYRKPLLGQAFCSEPRLTVNQLFKNLSLQSEAREAVAAAGQDSDSSSLKTEQRQRQQDDDRDPGSTSSDARGGYATDSARAGPGRSTSKPGALTGCRSDAAERECKRSRSLDSARRCHGAKEESGAAALSAESDERKKRQKKPGRREEMDRVYRRHINQLFIRGDSVILVVVHGT